MGSLLATIAIYSVVRQFDEGGKSVVHEALHESIERCVAIKVLYLEYDITADVTVSLFNEARAANRIEHPGRVRPD